MKLIYTIAAFTAATFAANATLIVVDNLNLPTPDAGGSQSTYGVQSFTPIVAGIGTLDSVTPNSPLPPRSSLRVPNSLGDRRALLIQV